MATETLAEALSEPKFKPELTSLLPPEQFEGQGQEDEEMRAVISGGTELASFMAVAARIFPRRIVGTPLAETVELVPTSCMSFLAPPARDSVQVIAHQRVRLLARGYVAGHTPEVEARIEILTARLNQLLPPVTDEQWKLLGDIANELDDVKNRREEIRKRYGLE